jgi:hypothetical protein
LQEQMLMVVVAVFLHFYRLFLLAVVVVEQL